MSDYEHGQAFGGVIDVLEAIGARYAIWGGVAVIAYGEPRFTQDMDILLSPVGLDVALFVRTLIKLHYHVDEIAVNRAMMGGFFTVIHLGYHIKTDFYVPVEPELKTMIADRVYLPFDEMRRAAYITASSVVAAKLRAYQESQSTRHLDDIASIIRLQGKKLERECLDIVAARLGLLGVWRAIWEQNQPE
ncbi:MAG TPA: hypothetical protein PLD25_31725 [Chloroflexota bacterium]|nr:hypothetical protein [Chloroflexota bacterium]HUM67606.1 hypothetical protein [Chloroflexota bacterium]